MLLAIKARVCTDAWCSQSTNWASSVHWLPVSSCTSSQSLSEERSAPQMWVGGASSSSTCPRCVNLHYCQHVSSTCSLLHILLIGSYTSIYYAYLTMMSWLVCWFAGQGKKGVASPKMWTVASAYSSDIHTSKLNWSLLVFMACWFHIRTTHAYSGHRLSTYFFL